MQLLMTHEKADFDALASLLGAKKLFPEGTALLPLQMNRNVQQFLNLYWDALPFLRHEDWQRRRVDEVLLVDTSSLNSVRGVVKRPDVHVIDHHLEYTAREGWAYQIEPVGATTTLLVEALQQRGRSLTPEEATLLLLGIYEDTGSLTYDSSTARDARAAAWLLEQGAQLDVVRRFLTVPLTPQQQRLYDDLQANIRWHRLHGQTMAVATAVAPDGFNDEISSVAHRLRETLLPAGLFVLVELGPDVQLVARSSHEEVDVSRVARELGGGGHSRAAAALIVGTSVEEAARRVEAILPNIVTPMATVSEIMSYGVQTITPDATVSDALRQMLRSGHEGYPVVDAEDGRITGLLTRRAVDRAMSHEMGDLPVSRVMRAGEVTVRPSESIDRVQELMLREGWGQIPVVAENVPAGQRYAPPVGIVTRTDLLNYWFRPVEEAEQPDLKQLMEENFSPPMWAMVRVVSEEAAALGMPLFFVGGLVRDLLLQLPATDLDMVVEGDAVALVQSLKKRFGGDVHTHGRFGTGKWFVSPEIWQAVLDASGLDGGADDFADLPQTIDFVTARSEFYQEPSALPEVERGSIKLDLHRRDFTINTLAVRLDGAHLGELLDFYGGVRDLDRKLIRVLHSLSFVDDPTRILRAVRLEQRLGFHIEPRTLELIEGDLPMLDRVTGDRIRHEIELALQESDPVRVMERLSELGIMEHIQPGLTWTEQAAGYFARVPAFRRDPVWAGAVPDGALAFLYFALWLAPLPREVQQFTAERLHARRATQDDVLAVNELLEDLCVLPPDAQPSEIAAICRAHQPRVLLAARIILGDEPHGAMLDRYYAEWRHVKSALTGNDLRQMGLEPGPLYAYLLDELLEARLDARVTDEAGEWELLTKLLRQKSWADDAA
ncbi:MAG: CBS domain-containing protein [Candidatus Promineifilaceae bacterium]